VQAHWLLRVKILFIWRTSESCYIRITTRINNGPGLYHAEAALIGDHHTSNPITLTNGISDDRVIQQARTSRLHQPVSFKLEAFNVEMDRGTIKIALGLANFRIETKSCRCEITLSIGVRRRTSQVKSKSPDNWKPRPKIYKPIKRCTDYTCNVATCKPTSLNDQRRGTCSSCCQCRDRTCTTRTHYKDIRSRNDVNRPRKQH
jgi:hypothetical protein